MHVLINNHHHYSHVDLVILQAITPLQEIARVFTEVLPCVKLKHLKQSGIVKRINCEVVYSISK